MSLKTIISKSEAKNVVFDYKAREIPLVVSEPAKNFVSTQDTQSSDFKLNTLIAEQAGIAQLQRDAQNDRIEEQVFTQLKEIQEKAYQEAYQLGRDEGREQALKERRESLDRSTSQLEKILQQLEILKRQVLADHESQIMQVVSHLASRIAMREVAADRARILPVILQVIEEAQADEQLLVRLAPEDAAFIEEAKSGQGKLAESLRRVRLEPTDGMTPGGCRLESNYGTIDATLEVRVERAVESLISRLPPAEQRTPSSSGEGHGA